MSDGTQPKKKGLVFAGVKAKIEVVPQGQLRVPAPPITSRTPSEEKVVPADTLPVIIPRPSAPGSRLLFGKAARPAPSGIIKPILKSAKPKPKPKPVLPPVEAAVVEKPKTTLVDEPKVAVVEKPKTTVVEEETVEPVKSSALLKLKEYFDSLKEQDGVDSYEEIDLENLKDSEPLEDGRFFYIYLEDIDEDFSELNEEFETIEFSTNGFFMDESDPMASLEDVLKLYNMFRDLDEKTDELEVVVENASEATDENEEDEVSLTSMEDVLADPKLGPLATSILQEEGQLPGEGSEERYADKYSVPVPEEGYIPTNRPGFSSFIYKTFKNFELPKLPEMTDPNACMTVLQSDRSEMYLYQQFIKEYLSWQSPYRGILVYHGLGSGKTCTSIAAAEALFASSDRKIIVMTPFSLRQNFIGEITTCGFHHFRLKNHWVKFSLSSEVTRLFAKNVLGIPSSYLAKITHIWVPDFSKEQNYQIPPNTLPELKKNYLTTQEQTEVREQINQILVYDPKKGYNGRIWFISYNGISKKELLKIACQRPTAFDNAVIIVDEIHNLVRFMQGTIEPYLIELGKKAKRKIDYEPIEPGKWSPKLCPSDWETFETDKDAQKKIYKRGYLLYRILLQAQNSKIIGLSGTPLINFPEELGILSNILHGYNFILEGDVARASVKEGGSDQKDIQMIAKIKELLRKNLYTDFIDVKRMEKTIQFRLTFLPEGIQKIEGQAGVERIGPEEDPILFEARVKSIQDEFQVAGIKILPASKESMFKIKAEPLLPPIGTEFKETFLESDDVTIKNKLVLIKRLTGLISYYKGSRKDLMPTVTKDETVFVPMSQFQQTKYSKARLEEIDIEEKKEKKKKEEGVVEATGRLAALYAEVYEIKNMPQSSNYRMGSRQACNFAFPSEVNRPKPRSKDEKETEVGGDVEDILDAVAAPGEDLGTTLEKEKEMEEKLKEEDAEEEEEEFEFEDTEVFNEETLRAEAIEAGMEGDELEAYIEMEREQFEKGREEQRALSAEEKRCRAVRLPTEKTYQQQLDRAKECLATSYQSKLQMNAKGLMETSPKYMKMLENIEKAPGASLVYSQFLQMEGIGIFSLAMDANGYDPIEIRISKSKQVYFSERTKASLKLGPSEDPNQSIKKYRYIKFTGAEEDIVRRYALLLFNGRFSELPKELEKPLTEAGWKNNDRGDLCRVFCITSAGAEGLSLKNVRAVHIMEPYWNDVRMAQVKGRAVRICSHAELPVAERTVEIFTYVTVFSKEAQVSKVDPTRIAEKIVNKDSLSRDDALKVGLAIPKGAMQYTLSSDERLWLISKRKKALIDNLQKVMKSAAVDCKLNFQENKETEEDKKFQCTIFGNVGDFLYDPNLELDIQMTRLMNEGSTKAAATGKDEQPKKKKFNVGKIGDRSFAFEPIFKQGTTIPEKYRLYDPTNVEYKKPVGEIMAGESKKNPGTYVPLAKTLKLF